MFYAPLLQSVLHIAHQVDILKVTAEEFEPILGQFQLCLQQFTLPGIDQEEAALAMLIFQLLSIEEELAVAGIGLCIADLLFEQLQVLLSE